MHHMIADKLIGVWMSCHVNDLTSSIFVKGQVLHSTIFHRFPLILVYLLFSFRFITRAEWLRAIASKFCLLVLAMAS